MAGKQTIIIAGASARAAAFSALRAGLEPYCFDLFADADLSLRCPVVKLEAAGYPRNLLREIRKAPPGPWMYTGGLENHPKLVEAISRERPLWGNGAAVLKQVRWPPTVERIVHERHLPFAPLRSYPRPSDRDVQWLIKPIRGAGGAGIRFWDPANPSRPKNVFYQTYMGDHSVAAIYVGSWMLGITEQLVGLPWLNARPFHYCGSISPAPLSPLVDRRRFNAIGIALAEGCGLGGLFGVDMVISGNVTYPVEVNPRYTASVEVLEHTSGWPYLWSHWLAFDRAGAPAARPVAPVGGVVGKAILFARESFAFPGEGPWLADLDPGRPVEALPAFADIPQAGSTIRRGWPVLTFFASGATVEDVREKLNEIAVGLNVRFWPESGAL